MLSDALSWFIVVGGRGRYCVARWSQDSLFFWYQCLRSFHVSCLFDSLTNIKLMKLISIDYECTIKNYEMRRRVEVSAWLCIKTERSRVQLFAEAGDRNFLAWICKCEMATPTRNWGPWTLFYLLILKVVLFGYNCI